MSKNLYISLFSLLLLIVSCGTRTKNTQKNTLPITPETALQRYLENGDTEFKWEVQETYKVGSVQAYNILLTSQNWREHIWTHQLIILVPDEIHYDGALLYIAGGRSKDGQPVLVSHDHNSIERFAPIAQKNKALVAIIRNAPNQPLYGDLLEDQFVSFTLHNFKKDKDFSWPLLFPMVKSTVKAMDAVQEFSEEKLHKKITGFLVTGESKRGWTTWLTAAKDTRVKAIAPMVIDVLNMPVSLDYQVEAWNEYSVLIEDYTKLGIPQTVSSEDGNALTQMVDPYSYRKELTMPKLIFIGTNDEFWPVDAVKNYIDEIPGENYLHYVPNAAHFLGDGEQAFRALSAFWGRTLEQKGYKELIYKIKAEDSFASLFVKSSTDELLNIYFWSADSEDRDFRDEKWESKSIRPSNKNEVNYKVTFPVKGFKAFYIDMEFSNPKGGKYTKSTRMYVMDNNGIL